MRASMNGLPRHLRKPLRDLLAAGGGVARDRTGLLVDGPQKAADTVRALAGIESGILNLFRRKDVG